MAYSKDGIVFEDYEHPYPRYPKMPFVLGHTYEYIGLHGYRDKYETNPKYRYKAVYAPYGNSPDGFVEEAPVVLVSNDALHWEKINNVKVVPSYVDCYTSILYNPLTARYQTTTRRRWGEHLCFFDG